MFNIPEGYKAQYSEGAGPLELQNRMVQSSVGNITPVNRNNFNSLQGFGVPGQQNTVISPEQAAMNEAQIRASIVRNNAAPSYQSQQQSAAAVDAANALKRKEVYAQWLNSKEGQAATQKKSTGILSNWFK